MQGQETTRASRRRGRVAAPAAAATAAAIATTVFVVASGNASHPGSRTLRIAEVPASFSFVDNPPRQRTRGPSASAGDMLVSTAKLLDESNRRVGRQHRVCVATRPGTERNSRANFQCTFTLKLRDGDITGQTAFRDEPSRPFAVTGGTRAYEGARGSIAFGVRKVGRKTLNEARIHLLP